MPVTIDVLENDRITVLIVFGRLSVGEVAGAYQIARGSANWRPDWNAMVDLADADLSDSTPDDARREAEAIFDLRGRTPFKRGIYVGRKRVNETTGRLYDAYLKNLGAVQLTRMFTDREACLRWLRAPWTDDERREVGLPVE
ncbi:MAG: hypothetical protein RIC16_16170 [Rhodospirillales bacterium]